MVILDTHTLIWLADDQSKISPKALNEIEAHAGSIFVSAITAFEMGILENKNRATFDGGGYRYYQKTLDNHFINEIKIDGYLAHKAASLPRIHHDPADRMIIATAQHRNLTIVTKDQIIPTYPGITTVW